MANKIVLKKSSVTNKVPLTTDLDYGELALNYTDGKLYYKKSDGTTIDSFNAAPVNITTASQSSSFAWSSNFVSQYSITAQANDLSFTGDFGDPIDSQKIIFRIRDNGVARALTWPTGASKTFRAIGVTLPTTTIVGKTLYVGCIYNLTDSRWDVVAIAQE